MKKNRVLKNSGLKSIVIIIVIIVCVYKFYTGNTKIKGYSESIKNFTITEVYDGDTFYINIENVPEVFGKRIAVRIRGIDTPEMNDKDMAVKNKAKVSKEALVKLLSKGNVVLYDVGRDKYFRLLAGVKVNNIDAAEYMIKNKYAKSYDGGKKPEW